MIAAPSASAGETGPMNVYRHADGQAYFSLSLRPELRPGDAMGVDAPRQVVALFDTSASQTGMYRDAALASLEALLAGMGPGDRVRLAAVDLDARPLSDAAAPADSPETAAALERLRQEAPLGTTDLVSSLAGALEMFDPQAATPRVVLYIGDGMSNANLVRGPGFAKLAKLLRAQRVSVSSYAIGPRRDAEVLAMLANQTGGNLYIDAPMAWADDTTGVTPQRATQENQRRAAGVGRVMAQWVRGTVVWPEADARVSGAQTLLPRQLPPLRSDRDTIVVGTLAPGAKAVTISAAAVGEQGTLESTWSRRASQANEAHAYLADLVNNARRDGGVSMTTVGSAGLAETGRMLMSRLDGLTEMAERAITVGDHQSAARIAGAVLQSDPGNLRAQTVQRVVASGGADRARQQVVKPSGPPAAAGGDSPNDSLELVRVAQVETLAPPQAAAGPIVIGAPRISEGDGVVLGQVTTLDSVAAADYPPAGEVTDGAFLSGVERRNRLFAQMLEKEIRNIISQARDKLSTSPAEAIQDLKLAMQSVQNAPELIADVRASLTDRLESALREASRSAAFKAELDRQREETAAAARELKLLNDRLTQKRQREKQLLDRFDALMDERRYEEASEVAQIVEETDPNGVTPVAAGLWAANNRADYLNRTYRAARAKGFIDSLLLVELAAVPLSDDPPIVYPSASEWEELTNRRKKYQAVDLKSQGEAELRISEALQGPLTSVGLDFTDTPLEEVVEFLRAEYQIEIQLDTLALEDLGIGADEPITVNLRNISLRSALRIMLKQLELTYIIKDEVLQITTEEAAALELTVKVYPVGDLVIDKSPIFGGGGGG
ncbi:MAG: hypothetical protein AAF790_09085, partial [Planctomycetota bacterium]